MRDSSFYVYRHIRLDTNTPFYVGKGIGDRANRHTRRNKYWRSIVKKVGYEVEIILYDLTEQQAFEKEIEFIDMYKKLNYCEANLTLGGEGPSGLKHSTKTQKKLSKLNKGENNPRYGIAHCKETKEKISHSQKGTKHHMFGKHHTQETKSKISNANKGINHPFYGKLRPKETLQKMSDSRKGNKNHFYGKKHSEETLQKMSNSQKGAKNHNYGKKASKETREKMKLAWAKRLEAKRDQ